MPLEVAGENSLTRIVKLNLYEKVTGMKVALDDLGHLVKT
jgi:hypothetical protein